MKAEITKLHDAVCAGSLPESFDELFDDLYDAKNDQFVIQENILLDFKEDFPAPKDDDYRSGLLKLFLAFHNTFGGIVVFGVRDKDFKPVGVSGSFDVEKFNSLVTEVFGTRFELIRRNYELTVDGERKTVSVVLVPKRATTEPVVSQRDYNQIDKGKLFIRERHEAKTASSHHLPLVFSRRENPFDEVDEYISGIQYSAPPSPSTLPNFIGRTGLTTELWKWLLLSRMPRIYLSGPGGSGKSTLAYEFLDQVAHNWKTAGLRNGENLDFALFVSAKETELNVRTGAEQEFSSRQFSTAEELYHSILTNVGGLSDSETSLLSGEGLLNEVSTLFDTYNGLIVIDDIDALSRSGQDTGEEDLFLICSQARKVIKLIYTLRNDASYAKNSAISVPGLDKDAELSAFLEECCELFGPQMPSRDTVEHIAEETSCLPLLIETVVGLRTNCSSYEEALRDFRDKGGDAARKYLYQREYDKLDHIGKSRQVLAALMEYGGPLGFDAICAITNASKDQVRSAINETANIFLKISTQKDETTGYSLSPSAQGFVRSVSKRLPYYGAVKRAVDHFRRDIAKSTPQEATIIIKLERLVREGKHNQVVLEANQIDENDAVRVNPKFLSVLGQAYVQSEPPDLSKARSLFEKADSFGYQDIFMLRAWFYAERKTGYRFAEAVSLCERVATSENSTDRHKSEFYSKIGECRATQARSISGSGNPDKLTFFAQAITAYLWAMHYAASAKKIDRSKTADWLNRAMTGFIGAAEGDLGNLFKSISEPIKQGLSFDEYTATFVANQLAGLSKSRDMATLRRAHGTLQDGISSIEKAAGKRNRDKIEILASQLGTAKKLLEVRIMQLSAN